MLQGLFLRLYVFVILKPDLAIIQDCGVDGANDIIDLFLFSIYPYIFFYFAHYIMNAFQKTSDEMK